MTTGQPTEQPTGQPTTQPSRQPTMQPTMQPSGQPTSNPTNHFFCEAGYGTSDNGRTCTPCAAGAYKAFRGNALCRRCPSSGCTGHTVVSSGVCSAGSYAPSGRGYFCKKCAPGSAKAAGNDRACFPCREGTFANTYGQSECTACDPHATDCGARSPGTCQAGYVFNASFVCVPCARGMYFTSDGSCMPCEAGSKKAWLDEIC
jgi:hypothetical protein